MKGPCVKGTSGPSDVNVTEDAERGERSRAGWADADTRRNPTPPSEHGSPADQDPAQGRARDPELENPDGGARSIGTENASSR
jgi:hypothetical protein